MRSLPVSLHSPPPYFATRADPIRTSGARCTTPVSWPAAASIYAARCRGATLRLWSCRDTQLDALHVLLPHGRGLDDAVLSQPQNFSAHAASGLP
jgi:hypothetical protein